MSKVKYLGIYKDLKHKIEVEDFKYLELLPSENSLIVVYNCSRDTLRRAIAMLVKDGYLQVMQGLGIRNIYNAACSQYSFTPSVFENLREIAQARGQTPSTRVLSFNERVVDATIAQLTGFNKGVELYHIQRLRLLDNKPTSIEYNYFLKTETYGLTPQIAGVSVYDYLEQQIGMTIVNCKRRITIEKISPQDDQYLNIMVDGYNCLAVVSSWAYNSKGIMFEFTQSHQCPSYFCLQDNAVRKR